MKPYEITNMIIDDFEVEDTVTADFIHNHNNYSITFSKSDLELINSWIHQEHTSLPADLPEGIIETLREEVKSKI